MTESQNELKHDECMIEFEAWYVKWCKDEGVPPPNLALNRDKEYEVDDVFDKFLTWQAAWNTRATSPAEAQIDRCKCSLMVRLSGDGCRYCNPQHYIDILEQQITDDSRQIEAIRAAMITLDADLEKVAYDDTRFTLLRFFKNDLKKILEEGNG